jgi:AAA+ superfamily predicted ATPase
MGMGYYNKNKDYIDTLPDWAREFAYKYGSKTANLYILHGNIRDYLPHKSNAGEFNFTLIKDYIAERIFGNKDIIVFYDRSTGVVFLDEKMAMDYQTLMGRKYDDIDPSEFMSPSPEESFFYLEKYFLAKIPKDKREQCRMVLIIDYAETIVPPGDLGRYNEEDRFCLVTLNRWAVNPLFSERAGDISIILLTENLVDISPRLAGSPATVKVNVPFPDEDIRLSYLESKINEGKLVLDKKLEPDSVAAMTSGLNLMNLNRLISENHETEEVLTQDYLIGKKKEIIETEAAGLLEFMETNYNLSHVSGHTFVKKRFINAARAIKKNRFDVLPMGYLIAGPVGTGKSFMVSAFAGEIGIPMVKFCNFRSKWQGDTESNLERILNILKSMAPVAVMIDEADAFLGNREGGGEGDSGTSNRVFAALASFMGNTEYRGKIIWFLITCRPDLVPIDLKRQGRAEEHLALFYPESDAEREDLFKTLVRKLNLDIRNFPVRDLFKKYKHDYSGADLEALLVRAKHHSAMADRIYVTRADMEEAMSDFVPAAYPYEIELQNLVAVVECTSKEMLPDRLKKKTRSDIIREISETKQLIQQK